MAKSRYPRPGQRLAPATLRELLTDPVPDVYCEGRCHAPLRLCDLDETAWESFPEETCRALGAEIVRVIGRVARTPRAFGEDRIPPLPQGVSLADLDLEARTANSLKAAGMDRRPQDLHTISIDGLLGLRGFWVKGLVDLLTAVEHLRDHPEARRGLRRPGQRGWPSSRGAARYPRPGHRVAPQALREILTDPVPDALVCGTPLEGTRLCDLDERVWDHLAPEAIEEIASLVVARAGAGRGNRAIRERTLPQPPQGIWLDDLGLENRTSNCLRREGFANRPEDLGKRTIGQMLALKAFGARCLVDVLTCLETLAGRKGKLNEKLTTRAKALAAMPAVSEVRFNDPRLGKALRATGSAADTLGGLVHDILKRRFDANDPPRLHWQLCDLQTRLEQSMERTLEAELIEIFGPADNQRDLQILVGYYGWDGKGGQTLEELGTRHALSRERIRQVCLRAIHRHRRTTPFAPIMDRALSFVVERLPMSARRLAEGLRGAGLCGCPLSLKTIRQAADFLSRDPAFALVDVDRGQIAIHPDQVDLPPRIVQAARRAVLSFGAARVDHVTRAVAAQRPAKVDLLLVEETLNELADFRWLDRESGWFCLGSVPGHGLSNLIDKVLSVTGRIDGTRLRAAIARYRRGARSVPPTKALLEFCRLRPGLRVEGGAVIADPPKQWRATLAGVEATMVDVLEDHGPVMERGAFEECCLRRGMNRFTFNAFITSSPVIAQYGRSVYGLLGTKVESKTVEAMIAQKSRAGLPKVLQTCGQTSEGEAYLAYRLSKAVISGGVITIPSAMRDRVFGRYTIYGREGRPAGTLVSKNGCAWGLGPVLRRQGARPGDHLVIVVDPHGRKAQILLGDEGLIDSVAGVHQSTA